jgi:3-hydroxyacyl-[acyl-carrier-protein] dehydratase
MLDTAAIERLLPHRHPFLFLDEVTSLEPGVRATGSTTVSADEPFFAGHFPGRPVMPGVLLVEAMAQLGAVALLSAQPAGGRLPFLAGIDRARFHRPVFPGDRLRLHTELQQRRGRVGRGHGRAFVGDDMVAEADFLYALVPAGSPPSDGGRPGGTAGENPGGVQPGGGAR